MNNRTFAAAVQMEELGHRAQTDIKRMARMAKFDTHMCYAHEEDAERHFESAAQMLREAGELIAKGAAELMLGYSKLDSATADDQEVLSGYARNFLS